MIRKHVLSCPWMPFQWWCHLVLQTEPKAGQLYVIYLETYFSFELWPPEEDARAFNPSIDKSKFKVWADLWCVFLSDIHLTFLLCDVFFDTNVKIWCTLQQIHVFLFFIKDIYNCFLPQYIHQSTVLPRDSFSKSSASLPFPFLLNHIWVSFLFFSSSLACLEPELELFEVWEINVRQIIIIANGINFKQPTLRKLRQQLDVNC